MNWAYCDQEILMLLSYFIHLSENFVTNNNMKVEVAVAAVVVVVVVVVGGGGGGGGEGEVVSGTFCLLFRRYKVLRQ
jgi:hypothetical protein